MNPEDFTPAIDVAEEVVRHITASKFPTTIAAYLRKLCTELEAQGFTREEAVQIAASLHMPGAT